MHGLSSLRTWLLLYLNIKGSLSVEDHRKELNQWCFQSERRGKNGLKMFFETNPGTVYRIMYRTIRKKVHYQHALHIAILSHVLKCIG
ncbi:hypothetical protein NPIL_119341 [Nephila pilipes]|uniref:Transposase n=1 Tax=Nephila pilipes TaxID=299642 RepID=A0A8X6UHY1_NEPPI|nr:hypothetical protein NPIL_119341 [Nephila pilipes]